MTEARVVLRDAGDADAAALNAIYNASVLADTASWDLAPWTLPERNEWLAGRRAGGFPVLVAVRVADGRVLGFGGWGPFRAKAGYRRTAELSLYVAEDARGQGVGRLLMQGILDTARAAGIHALVGGLSADNAVSARLHASFGFTEVGRLPQVGAKFGRWLDLVLYQLLLDEAPRPEADA